MIIGGIALLIAVPFVWNNYQKYQERERTIRLCNQITSIRKDIMDRIAAGEEVSFYEAVGAAQLGSITGNLDCNQIK
ncbi:MAG: hypothetical protein H9536_12360 [Aphanizomenon flos-aquae Clear-A1]|jgi:hypothetical protein|nr:hypothetical protein [Aphanizomenon flos-aquae Clear-A1]QSV67510.1 MAG: hypothetical protein HEQ12_11645 [Aphanizomenon flos-aquae DEX188]